MSWEGQDLRNPRGPSKVQLTANDQTISSFIHQICAFCIFMVIPKWILDFVAEYFLEALWDVTALVLGPSS